MRPLVDVSTVTRMVVTTGALAAVPVVATAGAASAHVPGTSHAGTPAVKAASTLSVAASPVPANGNLGGGTVTVRSGDTVSKIARAAGVSTQAVLAANNLAWSSTIYPGQVLSIPTGGAPATDAAPAAAPAPAEPSAGEAAVAVAKESVGLAYRFGGTSPTSGFDCSGLVQYAYAKVGVPLPRTSAAMRSAGYAVSEPRVGDLVLFDNYGHVAMYAGDGKIIDSPRTGESVSVRSLWTDDVQFRRVV
ncbi:Cell wall-associated hydrolase, NlpC family [Quadrisphaera granulorum]|uniref:Cell wall-associated NlpC family hydrolase n=1 Tax=Quadrisphaera granulorum TaxID=317664 RepID=A0A316AEF1_9ACTN|nr:cell wall-associated NlpC family hydrolase [Quadrisphaera granulorum]SZE94789.1 Cell wall-associated hydrolase, NlpC family [Quadrisphaera granulorum]